MTSVALIFGGQSPEHEVSIVSARFVHEQLSAAGYATILVGIGRDGRWHVGNDAFEILTNEHTVGYNRSWTMPTDLNADVVFPLVHGLNGEDGCLPGYCGLLAQPYVGGDPLNASLCWDKLVTRTILMANGIPQPAFIGFNKHDFELEGAVTQIEEKLHYPVFIKPSRTGSSIGVNRVSDRDALAAAFEDAFKYDYRVIAEQGLIAREIEIAALGADVPELTIPAEILSEGDFYDFEEKYLKDTAEFVIPAPMKPAQKQRMYEIAKKSWNLLNCYGMARIDFLVTNDEVYLNEINTCPGFTSISMYPKLWRESGVDSKELMVRLVELALNRSEIHKVEVDFHSKGDWWKGS